MAKYIHSGDFARRLCEFQAIDEHSANAVISLLYAVPAADVVEVVRCKNCNLSSEPKSVSRHDLYCNNYDVRFCEKEQKIVCGTHFCSYGERRAE